MTQEPQGQGWWQASDGQWYPPESHPSRAAQRYGPPPPQPYATQPYAPQPQAPVPHAPQPYGAPPQQYGPPIPPPKKGGGRGCIVALIIVMAILTVIGIGVVALVSIAGRMFEENIGKADCEFITDQQAATVLGEIEVFQLGGIASAVPVLDSRVLPEAETTCWGTAASGRIARFAESPNGGAAGFEAEVARARGTSTTRDDGITVETDPYFAGKVSGLGDEAFCTTLDLTGAAGVLVRQGERLVYVSVTADTPDDPSAPLDERTAGANCSAAQALARLVLASP